MTAAAPTAPVTLGDVDVACDVLAAHLLCQRALELAGKRLLNRTLRGTYTGDLRALHQQVDVTTDQLPRLLAGAFDWAEEAAVLLGLDPVSLREALTTHVADLLLAGTTYRIAALPGVLAQVSVAA